MNQETQHCLICGSPSNAKAWITGVPVGSYWNCERCGAYYLVHYVKAVLEQKTLSPRQIANLSGWLRENQVATLTKDNLDGLLQLPTPSVAERAEKLLVYLANQNPSPGMETVFPWNETKSTDMTRAMIQSIREDSRIDPRLFSVSWSENSKELRYLVEDYLTSTKQFLQKDNIGKHKISPEGWAFLDDLKKTNKGSKMAFVAMNFDKEFKTFYEQGIDPAIRDAGFDPKRVDQHEHVNRIDDEIIALINRSRFIVADFTGQKAGVYFEAGYALGMGLKVIWSCRKDELEKLHFDARQYNMLEWTADNLPDFRNRLKNRIEAVIRG